jgi:acyl-CoA thioesterase I
MAILLAPMLFLITSQAFFPGWGIAADFPRGTPSSLSHSTSRPLSQDAISILILGDSLTEGYGVEKLDAFPERLQKLLNQTAAQNRRYLVINGGVSGATSASASSRLKWHLRAKPSVVVIALGANDGLRGLKPSQTYKNLSDAIALARQNGVQVLLAGMKMPPNYGEAYRKEFEGVFKSLAKTHQVRLLPFLLEGVAGDPKMNLEDGIHPNAKGHEMLAKTVFRALEPLL